MSRRPIARSPDLLRLQNEGYDLHVRDGFLMIGNVPYVDSNRTVQRGTLISKLELSGDKANKPNDHVAYWTGSHPCHCDGRKITSIENSSAPQKFAEGIQADFTFSAKSDYRDYHHKITTYIGRIAGEAAKLDPSATARVYPVITADEPDGPFKYEDTATSRAGIGVVNAKVAGLRIGIAGLGGTGGYIFDAVAKTPVAEIRGFDGDVFSQHNAFRAPGAPSLEQLRGRPQKAAHLNSIYSRMKNGIVMHDIYLDETNVYQLDGLDFVFVCMDRGDAKRAVVNRLVANKTSFVDVGMGVLLQDDQLRGIVRVTLSTPSNRERAAPHISYADGDGEANEYSTNIQIAELNMMNASLAVMVWKRFYGVYPGSGRVFYAGYSIATGELVIEEDE